MRPAIDHECFKEWAILNKNVFLKRNLAFYYTDLNKIRLYLEREKSSGKLKVEMLVEFKINNTQTIKYTLTRIIQEIIKQDYQFSFEFIESDLNLNFIQNENIISGTVSVVDLTQKNFNTVSLPIPLNIKLFRSKNKLKHTFICSDLRRNYNAKDVNSFRMYIEMHKINGYDKLIIYNNSIQDNEQFNHLIREYDGYVQIIQFKCMPNFNDKSTLFITDFYQNPYWHFESVVYNECYLHNMDKYKYITINDHYENLMPRYLKEYSRLEDNFQSKCYYPDKDQSNNKTNLEIYLNLLKKDLKLDSKISFHFSHALYLKITLIEDFFQQLKIILKKKDLKLPYLFKVVDKLDKLSIVFKISNLNEHNYALNLLNIYKSLIEPLKTKSRSISDLISEAFNRHFYLSFLGGKTIHNTLLTKYLAHHFPLPFTEAVYPVIVIPNEYGHVSHFRRDYKKYFPNATRAFSITELHFDFNYFFCYYKPILEKFEFNF